MNDEPISKVENAEVRRLYEVSITRQVDARDSILDCISIYSIPFRIDTERT